MRRKKESKNSNLSDVAKALAQVGEHRTEEPRRSISLRVDGQLYDRAKAHFGNRLGIVFETALRDALQALDDDKKNK